MSSASNANQQQAMLEDQQFKQKYRVKRKIDQGGFGKVYLATDRRTKDKIVIKMNSNKVTNDHEFDLMQSLQGKGF